MFNSAEEMSANLFALKNEDALKGEQIICLEVTDQISETDTLTPGKLFVF